MKFMQNLKKSYLKTLPRIDLCLTLCYDVRSCLGNFIEKNMLFELFSKLVKRIRISWDDREAITKRKFIHRKLQKMTLLEV